MKGRKATQDFGDWLDGLPDWARWALLLLVVGAIVKGCVESGMG